MRNRIHHMKEERDGGFTLIELLIVIVVLGILAGIVVFGVGTFRADAKTAACKADKKTVRSPRTPTTPKTGAFPANMAALTGGRRATSRQPRDRQYVHCRRRRHRSRDAGTCTL